MKQNVILKSIIRKPIIAILLTLLIGLISYGFVGKAVETILVYRETNRLEGYYRSIGYIEQTEYENPKHTFAEGAEILHQSDSIAFEDFQRQTAGVMKEYYNLDYSSGTMDIPETLYSPPSTYYGEGVHNLDYWFYGELIHFKKQYAMDKKVEFFAGYELAFTVKEVLAGYPEKIQAGKNYLVWIPARWTMEIEQMIPQLDQMELNETYLIHGWNHEYAHFNVFGLPVQVENSMMTMNLKPVDGKDEWYVPLKGAKSLDLSLPEYTYAREQIDCLNENLHAIILTGTSDMSAIPYNQLDAKMNYLVEGRWLNRQDEDEANKVIVITKDLAKMRGLGLGDKLTVTMRPLKDPFKAYIRNQEDIENWKTYPSQEVTYEIVGIYSNSSLDEGTIGIYDYSSTESFVPNSTFADEYAFPNNQSPQKEKAVYYSFVLKDPRMQDPFIDEFEGKMADAGFTLHFSDNNGRNFALGADPLRKSNLIGSLLFSAALLMAVALSIFLYLRQQKKNYATLRALGVPVKTCNQHLIIPLLVLSIIGSLVGALLSWQNAHTKAAESLSQLPLPSGVFPNLSLNPMVGFAVWLFVLLVLLLAVYLGNRKVAKTPVLELLQNTEKKAKNNLKDENLLDDKAETHSREAIAFDRALLQTSEMAILEGKAKPKRAIAAFSRSSVLRAPLKSLLTIVVAAALLFALGWLQSLITVNRQEISRLYESAEIQIDIAQKVEVQTEGLLSPGNNISRKLVDWMEDSPYIGRTYKTRRYLNRNKFDEEIWDYVIPPYLLITVSDLDEALQKFLTGYEITYLEDYGPEDITEIWTEADLATKPLPLIAPEDVMALEKWHLGDEIELELGFIEDKLTFKIIGSSRGGDNLVRVIVSDTKHEHETTTFTYHYMIGNLSAMELKNMGRLNYHEVYLYTNPKMNYRLKEFKEALAEQTPKLANSNTIVQIWDEELMAVVEPMERNLSLMERLYPITMVISAVIGGVLCLLLVLNQAKETALLRMLGVEKGKIRAMQVKQILFLTLIGLLLGFSMLISLRGLGAAQPSVAVAALVYLVGALLGALLGAIQVSNKKPMELLQVKE